MKRLGNSHKASQKSINEYSFNNIKAISILIMLLIYVNSVFSSSTIEYTDPTSASAGSRTSFTIDIKNISQYYSSDELKYGIKESNLECVDNGPMNNFNIDKRGDGFNENWIVRFSVPSDVTPGRYRLKFQWSAVNDKSIVLNDGLINWSGSKPFNLVVPVSVPDPEDPDDPPPGGPGGTGGSGGSGGGISLIFPIDPNEIIGPKGYGPENYVAVNKELDYKIFFENDSSLASAAAREVKIIQEIDSSMNPAQLRIKSFGFGKYAFNVPKGKQHYTKRLDLVDSIGYYVDFTAGLDVVKNEIFFKFSTVDPSTGLAPSDPEAGFLPVNDSMSSGEGFVSYVIEADEESNTEDTITACADIIFDSNDPIETNTAVNIIDAEPPTSSVIASSLEYDSGAVSFSWHGSDDSSGSGIRAYDILYKTSESEELSTWLRLTTDTSTTIEGEVGEEYQVYCVAKDNAGNEEVKDDPDISFTIRSGKPVFDSGFVSQSFDEDDSLRLSIDYFTDHIEYSGNTDSLLWSAVDTGMVSVDFDSAGAWFNTSVDNWYGEDSVSICVTNTAGKGDTGTMDVSVLSVNDTPMVVNNIEDITLYEDTPDTVVADLNEVFMDVEEGSSMEFEIESISDTSIASVSIDTHDSTLVFSPVPDSNGSCSIVVTGYDSLNAHVSDTFDVTIIPVNDPPKIISLPELSIPEDSVIELELSSFETEDVEGDSLELLAGTGENYELNGLEVVPDPDYYGELEVPVFVSDGVDTSAAEMLNITVTPVNDPPEIISLPELSIPEDSAIELELSSFETEDVEGDSLELLVGTGENYELNGLEVVPDPDYYGELEVPVFVSDGVDTSAPEMLNITVTPVDDPPVIDILPGSDTVSSGPVTVEYNVSDDMDDSPVVRCDYPSPKTFSMDGFYEIDIEAEDDGGNITNKGINVTIESGPPAAVDSLYAVIDTVNSSVEIVWVNSHTENDLSGYRVYMNENEFSDVSGSEYVAELDTGTNSYTVENLTLDKEYFFGVSVYDDSGKENTAVEPIPVTIPKIWDISVYTRDNAFQRDNFVMPRLYIMNSDTDGLDDFTVYYYFRAEGDEKPAIKDRHTPYSDVSLEELEYDHYRIKYDFTGSSVEPGAEIPHRGGNLIWLYYTDWNTWYKGDDYSWSGSSHFVENENIAVYRKGRLIYGSEPDIKEPADKFDWDIRVYSKDYLRNSDRFLKPGISIVNNDTSVLEDFTLYYYVKAEGDKEPELRDFSTPHSEVSLQELGYGYYRVKYDFTGSYLVPDKGFPSIGGSIVVLNNEDFSPLYKENDYSWSDTKRFDENQNIAVYYKDSLIYGSEPDVTDDGDNSDWDISVYTRDARINRDNSIMPVIYIQNNDTRVLDDFEVYYLIKSEFGKIPEIANRHTPESDVSLESEDGDHYRVKYDYTGSYVIPGGDIPRGKGSVIEIKYPDNGDINKDNDYSWSGSRHLRENSRVLVYRNNELIYGIPPSPEDTITAKTHDAFSLKAVPVPVRRNGRISFYLISEKGIVDDINGEISIYNKVGDMVYSEEVDIVPVEHARRNNYFLKWDLKSGSGKGCIPGSYVVMLKLDGIEDTYQRMIYIGYR